MSDNLLNPSRQNWNIPTTQEEETVPSQSETGVIDQMFPLRTFSALGAGDAPIIPKVPRLRSRLFTISTRSVMASHSELNVSYTESTTSVGAGELPEEFVPVPVSPSPLTSHMDFGMTTDARLPLMEDVKPINYEGNNISLCPATASPTTGKPNISVCEKAKECRYNLMRRRCFHTSLEDLRSKPVVMRRGAREAEKNRRKSAPITSARGQMIEAANDLLVEENKHLHMTINGIKRRLLITKSVLGFVMQGVKRRGKMIKHLEIVKLEKEQQCAARLILHSLLLNSWRNTKRELDMKTDDNVELRKSVENFSLQVQVLRHIQTSERQKFQEKTAIIANLNDEVGILKEENLIMRKEVEKMENKLNSLQAAAQNISDENQHLTREITNISENRDKLLQSLERERIRSDQFGRDNETMKETLKHLETQLKEATDQKSHWQERARCSESEVWELQLHLDARDSNIKELSSECESLRDERMQMINESSNLRNDLDHTQNALQVLGEKTDELMQSYEQVKAERDAKANTIQDLEKTLDSTKKERVELERELSGYKLYNVRRRREWGNALYFFASPVDAFRRKLT